MPDDTKKYTSLWRNDSKTCFIVCQTDLQHSDMRRKRLQKGSQTHTKFH